MCKIVIRESEYRHFIGCYLHQHRQFAANAWSCTIGVIVTHSHHTSLDVLKKKLTKEWDTLP